ncbi:DNA-processing protein DprA [Trueperella pecoris]|uniref:DNA-processing protein DprA n=1 Tax=Trueperella pecoris TaxID=2733571 RepID=UPI001ABECBCE|nr:DNA-processing protein DprA [Trueperella pecoris]QTG76100.1 DNA-processing protein DprA [Trueperella pecoris]
MSELDELQARIEWSRMTEGADPVAHALISHLGAAGALDFIREPGEVDERIGQHVARWRHRLDRQEPFKMGALDRAGVSVVAPGDELWPSQLNDLGDKAPILLWVKGDPKVLAGRAVAIVGSRAATANGVRIARDFAYEISREATVISGGAFGIDAAAHEGAMLALRPSVIVSAGGADRVYPRAHDALFAKTLELGGAVVSESPLGAAPQRFRFLARNRIIAGLARATLVVEAPIRSGALSTARHAQNIGRPVGAVPGPIDVPQYQGCIDLLRNDGTPVANVAHLRELMGTMEVQDPLAPDFFAGSVDDGYDPRHQRVFDATPVTRAASVASIAATAGLTLPETLTVLGYLLLAGRVVERDGRWKRTKVSS